MVDMQVEIGGVRLANPVMPASGTFADGLDKAVDFERLGAMVIKTITRELRVGNALPRVCETPEGMLNSIGIPSKGMPYFHEETLPTYARYSTPLVVSISAPTVDGFASLAEEVSLPGVAAIEANISCPNLEEDGKAFANETASAERATAAIRRRTSLPLWVKLSPNVTDIAEIARAVEAAGADALVVANTFLAMAVDIESQRPRLGSVTGGLSGPAIRPIVLRMAWQCARAVDVPIVGCGGIATAEDAIEYMLAGASAVQVGTVTFVHPTAMISVLEGIESYCMRRGYERVTDLVGALSVEEADETDMEWVDPLR